MFKVTNLSNNPLPLTDVRIAPGETIEVPSVSKKERGFETRGWLRIIKVVEQEPAPSAPTKDTKDPKKDTEDPKKTQEAGKK